MSVANLCTPEIYHYVILCLVYRKLVIGGDEMSPDSTKEGDNGCDYVFTWLTSGFQPTKSGQRSELAFIFKFENAEVVNTFQVKMYSREKSSHLTWGTEVKRIELEVRGMEPTTGATPYKNLAPTNVTFK